ncbi:catechol 2,3-dioxygenase-like lactoylglutathione lyase family enzyme [Chitinophaga skermanii]|uniref:Catechol 2,3-dioxygenase-like lactoylglutathione lyase family enzyme n=1 Tax=Chitinophaga skermanii TaxID=331697 RepID=A0A327QT99_9BACT|nr:VOC family protein [Chitinophaga skermanii]RAJ06643.1 catechol 2,3-dioxygenase-like lactoylglutathione lyase family enzyme [Chitinophaga skermanii]
MKIDHLDHLVLTVADIAVTCAFYQTVMGMEIVTFGTGRKALLFGSQKINLHQKGQEFEPKAAHPTSGSADLCFISSTPIDDILAELHQHKIPILEGGIVERTGAIGKIKSVYFRDPDFNLIEVSNHIEG